PGAAETLAAAVLEALAPRPGEHAVDLYAGVGLYAAPLAEAVGVTGRVDAVEGSAAAVRDARRNLHDLAEVRLHEREVGRWLGSGPVRRCDLVVLDPPRAGAGAEVVRRIVGLRPRAVAYVACDPAARGRDVRTFADLGWGLTSLRAFDLFPMTHHVECVALLEPLVPVDG
ncbi:MAG TPA: methyltransferase, partial [Candidatus Limnocylindria bacterium]|nr:methyltransferase [Candidatus Limnocylindria bacterium]